MRRSIALIEDRIQRVGHDFADLCAGRPGFPIELLILVCRRDEPHVDVHIDDREDTPRASGLIWARAMQRPAEMEADVA